MKIGIGIDTGGTYTDAAAYDFHSGAVLGKAKSPTTKRDLSIGIMKALDGIDPSLLQKAELVSLSTTLATNACVENKGGRVGLVMIGADKKSLEISGAEHGLPPVEELLLVDAEITISGEIKAQPDWDKFQAELKSWIKGRQAVAIVQFAARNSGALLEKQARDIIRSEYGLPVVCGHELYTDLNMMRRGASVLLNARLLPIIEDFLASVKHSLKERNVNAPIVIVRSDGTLMSESFAAIRPVETLLCGPAASAMYGASIAGKGNGLIADMGGTTSDIAIIANGLPMRAKYGVDIGQWKTFVKGMYIHTFGLGGDSAVRYDNQYQLTLGPERVVPLCMLAHDYPQIKDELLRLTQAPRNYALWLHEFFVLSRKADPDFTFTPHEQALYDALQSGPVPYMQASELLNRDRYAMQENRLEREGIILRAGLTPTDIMHICGDFSAFDAQASELAVTCVAQALGMQPEELCSKIYGTAQKKLYTELVESLITQHDLPHRSAELGAIASYAWETAQPGHDRLFAPAFHTDAKLIGLGAPIHVFLNDVANAFDTECVVPRDADVANALGALLGKVSCEYEIDIDYKVDETGTQYVVHGDSQSVSAETLEEAVELAAREAKAKVQREAKRRGASDELELSTRTWHHNAYDASGAQIYLGTTVTATATGPIAV